jgi:HK97 family phage major capsid protein
LLASVPQGAVTPNLASGLGYENFTSLIESVDHAYYVNGAFMASPSTFNYLLTQLDATGRPFYNIDTATGLMMIAGKPLYINAAMPAFNTPNSPVVLFGDFSRAYSYLNGGGIRIRILRERFADVAQNAALIYHRLGAAKLVSGAVKSLVTAAS